MIIFKNKKYYQCFLVGRKKNPTNVFRLVPPLRLPLVKKKLKGITPGDIGREYLDNYNDSYIGETNFLS